MGLLSFIKDVKSGMDDYNGGGIDIDDLDTECPCCETEADEDGDGHYICPECGNEGWLKGNEIDWEFYEFEDADGRPVSCSGCGGEWPDCKYSCERFDD